MRESNFGFFDPGIFAMGEKNRNNKSKVLDWDKVANLIIEKKPVYVEGGLKNDWFYTRAVLLQDNQIIKNICTGYLGSTWAIPAVIFQYKDGTEEEFELYTTEEDYNSKIMWNESSLNKLKESGYEV